MPACPSSVLLLAKRQRPMRALLCMRSLLQEGRVCRYLRARRQPSVRRLNTRRTQSSVPETKSGDFSEHYLRSIQFGEAAGIHKPG